MIRISQLRLPMNHGETEIRNKAAKILRIPVEEVDELQIVRQSLDARRKSDIFYTYTVDVRTKREAQTARRAKSTQVSLIREESYRFPEPGEKVLEGPPVIVGSGPAGLFCGLMLAKAGYCPLILERGEDVDSRKGKVEAFWAGGVLDPESNVQFGEGGAGTFSDGKLNTLVKDPAMRNREVLRLLTEYGADKEILYVQKPHIGTDVLSQVVKRIRLDILKMGGQVRFGAHVTDLVIRENRITGVELESGERIRAQAVVLAVGHSARDTFSMLWDRQIPMAAKSFAVGLRIQHPQEMINVSQYGEENARLLGPASYKAAWQSSEGRGVYTFCMCPGGYVVNASSETGRLAVNGMSNHDRGGENANSAVIVTVTPEDFPGDSPLSGVEFQRRLEAQAYRLGDGAVPVQLYGDFKADVCSGGFGGVIPQMKGRYGFANLRRLLPESLHGPLAEGIDQFEHRIRGFARPDSILAGVESRTSSPVRIHRDESLQSQVRGLYPCGEGAGYAGGITSAAMDGLRVAEEIARTYRAMR